MLFNSFNFFVFFPLVTALYFLLPHAWRWAMLLLASCVFYMFFIPEYILILLFTIVIDYFAGILIEKSEGVLRKRWLITSLIANIGVLAVFKYYNFFNANLEAVADFFGWTYGLPALEMVLPIGLSFHTFQAMSYTIEVYRGNQKAERHPGIYALYVMYYPQLVAGPIERPQNILPQLREKHRFDYSNVTNGLKLMAWGLFKKVVIADRLAVHVNSVYDHPENYAGISLFIATVFFAVQVYCDFSGYSDIAIGSSRVMGIRLMRNFDRPYFSKTIAEFWRRWHISLFSWFNDYLYNPLVIAKRDWGKYAVFFALMITFTISGFWHGANWNYICFGFLHGVFLVFAMVTIKARKRLRKSLGIESRVLLNKFVQAGTVFLLVVFSLVIFRSGSMSKSLYMLEKIVTGIPEYFYKLVTDRQFLWLEPLFLNRYINTSWFDFLVIFTGIAIMESMHWLQRTRAPLAWLSEKSFAYRWACYFSLVLFIILFGVYHDQNAFIYFQF